LLHCSRSESISTGLFTRKDPLVNHDDVKALFGEPVSGSGAGGTSADDQNIVVIVHDVMFMISRGYRGAVVV
jgi:hypothetical protein